MVFGTGNRMLRQAIAGVCLATPLAAPAWAKAPVLLSGGAPSSSSHPQGYLGIDVRDVAEESVTVLKLHDSRGAEIIRVDHDGPAGTMGLREHDVILQVNSASVDGEDQCRRMLHEMGPGRSVVLVVSRDGQTLTLSGQMADKSVIDRQAWLLHLAPGVPPSSPPAGPQAPATGLPTGESSLQASDSIAAGPTPRVGKSFLGSLLMSPSYTGAILERLGAQMAAYLGLKGGIGLLVRSIIPNSPAAVAGLQANDIVVRANGQPVNSPSRWARAVKDAKGGPILVTVLRDHQEHTVTLVPDAKHRSSLEAPGAGESGDDGEAVYVVRATGSPGRNGPGLL